MIYRILKETGYTGVFYGFKTIEIDGKTKQRPKEEWIRLEFPELRIIDQAVFDKAQELLAQGRSRNAPKWNHEYLLVRHLRCQCNYAVRAKSSTKRYSYGIRNHNYYICYGKDEHVAEDCPVPNIRADYVDNKAWESLEQLLRDPEKRLRGLQRAQQLQRERNQDALAQMESVEQKRLQYLQELDELYQDYKDKVIRREIYLKRSRPIEDRLRAAEAVQQEYQEKLSQEVLSDSEITDISGQLRQLNELLESLGTLEYKHKRNLIELMRVTGQFKVEDGEHILILKVHEYEFDRIKLGLVQQKA